MISITEHSIPLEGTYLHNPYLTEYETGIIAALAMQFQARTFIEFGVNVGLTAKNLLQVLPALERYIGIDVPPGHKPTLEFQNPEVPSKPGILASTDGRFELLLPPGGSMALAPKDLPRAEFIFIDGDHSRRAVFYDTQLAREVVTKGGVIVWHDYGNPDVEVTTALDQLQQAGWPIYHIADTNLAVMKGIP